MVLIFFQPFLNNAIILPIFLAEDTPAIQAMESISKGSFNVR
jgi:hypothetical protein